MLKFLPLIFIMSSSYAARLTAVSGNYNFQEAPEYQAILTELKLNGEFAVKATPDLTPVAPKTMGRGAQIVAEAKARNKALIAAQTTAEKAQTEADSELSDLDKLKREDQKTRDGWKKEVQDQLQQWKKEQEIFLGRLKVYKENTFEIPVKKEVIVEKKVIPNLPEVFIVNSAFAIPVRDQSARATCSSFAGIRALEIILNQNKIDQDLSEQYFYWASKPDCQKAPCVQKGSWVMSAYRYSQQAPQADIPTETNCAYQVSSVDKNETQVPLTSNCHQGVAKVEKFQEVRTLADVIETLKTNTPVIMAAKLSENFYKNKGLVTLADANKVQSGPLDSHALGHAFLAVGVMELPEKIQATEGSYCIVVANSWGKGWGAGGYSCLTQNWLTKYRQPSPFVAVSAVSAK